MPINQNLFEEELDEFFNNLINSYLNYLSLGYKIEWSDEIVYFPFEVGDQSVIAQNQRVSKIKPFGR